MNCLCEGSHPGRICESREGVTGKMLSEAWSHPPICNTAHVIPPAQNEPPHVHHASSHIQHRGPSKPDLVDESGVGTILLGDVLHPPKLSPYPC